MQSFAVTLARNGYLVVSFDFRGHGRNPRPLTGDVTQVSGATRVLVAELAKVAAYARTRPESDGRLALLGHSMASDIVVRTAQRPDVPAAASVAVSMFAPTVEPGSPRNLLTIVGAWEPAVLEREARRAVAMAPDAPAPKRVEEGRTYGHFADGTARRLVLADGVEHIAVLYSREATAAARDWLDAAFERTGSGFNAARGPWIAILIVALVALGWPLSKTLPRVVAAPTGGGRRWRAIWPVVLGPAVLTPLLLRALPTDVLPVLVADYLAAHFLLYGVLTAAGSWWLARRDPPGTPTPRPHRGRLLLAAALVALYAVGAVGLALDGFVASFLPTGGRWGLLLAMLVGTLPYMLADEWLTRGRRAARGAYPATKVAFLLSLGLAVALDVERLFFLLIIVPAMIGFFVIYGLFSRWAQGATAHPLAGGLANALAFAWALAVTFPLLGG